MAIKKITKDPNDELKAAINDKLKTAIVDEDLDAIGDLLDDHLTEIDLNTQAGLFQKTALHIAAEFDTGLFLFKRLVANGANLNAQNMFMATALGIAIDSKNRLLIDFLLSEEIVKKIDLAIPCYSDLTPLFFATIRDDFITIRRLVGLGADLSQLSSQCQTVLFNAVNKQNFRLIEFFVRAGLPLNLRDKFGCTVLHYAINLLDLKVAKLLINNGAKLDIENCDGKTPLDVLSNITADLKEEEKYRIKDDLTKPHLIATINVFNEIRTARDDDFPPDVLSLTLRELLLR